MEKSCRSALLVQFSLSSPSSLLLPLHSLPSLVLAQCSDKHKNRLKGLSRHSMLGVPSLQILTPHSAEHGSHPIALQTKGRETWREVGAHKWNCSVHSLGFLWRTFHQPAQWGRESSRIHSEKSGATVINAEMPIISILTGLIVCHVELVRVCCSHTWYFLCIFLVEEMKERKCL